MSFCVAYPVFWDFFNHSLQQKKKPLWLGEPGLPTTVCQRSEKNNLLSGFIYFIWVYVRSLEYLCCRMSSNNQESEAVFIYSKEHLIHTQYSVFSMHSLSGFFQRIHSLFNTSHRLFFFFLLLFGSLTFIICEWRYDTVQQWALCVFSVENVCERWPAAEWEAMWTGLCASCVGTLKSVIRQDKEYSVCWCFHLT